MINLRSITELVDYKPTYIKFTGYDGGAPGFTVRLIDSSRLIPVNYKANSDEELLENLYKFEFLEELDFSSCDEIILKNIPKSLKVVRLGHPFFNHDIIGKIQVFVSKCCHEKSDYIEIKNVEDLNFKRNKHDSNSSCIYCKFVDTCECGHIDNNLSNMINSYAVNKFGYIPRQVESYLSYNKNGELLFGEHYENLLNKNVSIEDIEKYNNMNECMECKTGSQFHRGITRYYNNYQNKL